MVISNAYFPASGQQSPPIGTTRVRLVYNNDIHEHWEELAKSISAFDYFSKTGEQQGADVLRLNAGDTNTGNEASDWSLGVRLLNGLKLHATTLGNHELALSPTVLLQALRQSANFPTLVSNLAGPAAQFLQQLLNPTSHQPQIHIVQGTQGSYGLIGITLPAPYNKPNPTALSVGLSPQDFQTTCQTLQQGIHHLQAQGLNKIIVLSHLGFPLDQRLAQTVSGIDVIVGGDSHDILPGAHSGKNYVLSPSGEPVLITQAGANGEYVGVADLVFNVQGQLTQVENHLFKTDAFAPEPNALFLLHQALPPKIPLAYLSQPIDNRTIHQAPNAMAQFIADTARQLASTDIAFVRSSEIRKSLPAGLLTSWELEKVMPYNDTLVQLRLSGQEIWDALNRSAQGLRISNTKHSPLLHAAGLAWILDSQTGCVRSAVVWNTGQRRWLPLQLDKTYTVALGEYAVQNAEEFPEFAHPERIQQHYSLPMRAVFTLGLQQHQALQQGISLPQPDNRLIIQQI